mmetsp:Transcript_2838/g.8911  ORF Transcript_2838/g.8911 Transcript_2838/m.8911 type:complete len:209 (-) Transcript_2838:224-850(-)
MLHVSVHREEPLTRVQRRQCAAEAPEVSGGRPPQAKDHFGGADVAGANSAVTLLVWIHRAAKVDEDHLVRLVQFGCPSSRTPWVWHLVIAAITQHQVGALEVRVHNPGGVHEGEAAEQLGRDLPDVAEEQAAATGVAYNGAQVDRQRLEDQAGVPLRVQEGVQEIGTVVPTQSLVEGLQLPQHLDFGEGLLHLMPRVLGDLHGNKGLR